MASDYFKTPSFVYPILITLFLLITFSGLNDHFGFITFSTILSSQNNDNNNNTLVTENSETYLSFYEQEEKRHVERLEKGLSRARAAIREAVRTRSFTSHKNESFIPRGPIYKNPYAFHQSHIEMEKRFRVWAYKEGDFPLFHNGPMKDIYSIEGQFIDELESSGKSPYLTPHPEEATVFFLPVSVTKTVMYLYRPRVDYRRFRLQNVVTDYIGIVSKIYPYWNRSKGADHFFVGCHDWGPDVSTADPELYENVIRVLCNANSSEGFQPARDATLPEIKIPIDSLGPPSLGQSLNNRSIFAFFAGGRHGYVRSLLFLHWNDKNNHKIQVLDYLPNNVDYFEIMGRTKFCLCPSGWEVASPRLVESIYAGCVPVIISDNYVLPFSDVLDWSKFSVHITVDKISEIEKILEGISYDEYVKKQKLLKLVQRHFTIHRPAEPYDLLDMVFHSIWLRRLNVQILLKKL